ncbi:glycosyltransferase [Mycolicibacterium sp.]|uniref:glycosyltransferase n=1 Tax=Mycolicibacterium sp. TaxID=2320850 RepID=UPI001A21EE4F|nr:glycosyltransferase [Mycolicibacterium sp.]MBJ7336721.1 hypothetical protein [Mycolicibacterium sp.]
MEENLRRAQHLLLTKFNAPLADSAGERPGLNREWLDMRLDLFERWPLRSVRGQSRAADEWLIFVDSDTAVDYLENLAEVISGDATIVGVSGPLTDDRIAAYVAAHLLDRGGLLITTRLDSDDALASDYVERIHAVADSGWRGFVNPRTGFQLVGDSVLKRWDSSGPFMSYLEDLQPGSLPRTVLSIEHYQAHLAGPVKQLGGKPSWLQVVHGRNLANSAEGVRWSRAKAAKAMGLELPEPTGASTPLLSPIAAQLAREAKWQIRRHSRRRRDARDRTA